MNDRSQRGQSYLGFIVAMTIFLAVVGYTIVIVPDALAGDTVDVHQREQQQAAYILYEVTQQTQAKRTHTHSYQALTHKLAVAEDKGIQHMFGPPGQYQANITLRADRTVVRGSGPTPPETATTARRVLTVDRPTANSHYYTVTVYVW